MSTDLKNSILLWVGAIAFAGFFWAWLHFDISRFIPPIPPQVFWPLLSAVAVLNILRGLWHFWRNRNTETS